MSDYLLARPSRKIKNLEIYDFVYNEIKEELKDKERLFNEISEIKKKTLQILRKQLYYKHFVNQSKNLIRDLKLRIIRNNKA